MRVFCELDPQRQGLHQEGAKVRITRQAEHLALEWWKEKACADTDPTAVWYYHAWTEEGRIAAGFREKQKSPSVIHKIMLHKLLYSDSCLLPGNAQE